MKIAIAGAGDVAAYFIEEFSQSPHEIVVLSSSSKRNPSASNVAVRTIVYIVHSLKVNIQDCNAIVSILDGPNEAHIASHLAILEACVQSRRCKRFIPSGWTTNMFPDQPL
jgi:putative NADH-flavin reductase